MTSQPRYPDLERPDLVSVVMTTHNGERFVRPAVASVLAQTHRHLELVIVDDGSTDATLMLLEAVDDVRVRLLRQANQGHSAALNVGLSAARSDYVAIMDHDDLCHPRRLEVQLGYMRQHPECGLLGTWYETISEEDEVLGPHTVPVEHEEICDELRNRGDCIAGPSVMLRRRAAIGVGGYRSEFDLAQDYDLALRISEEWRVSNLPVFLFRWRLLATGGTFMHYWRQTALGSAARECARRRSAGIAECASACVSDSVRALGRTNKSPKRLLLANAYRGWGVTYYSLGHRRKALSRLCQSLLYRPIQPRVIAFLILLALPQANGQGLRRWLRAIRDGGNRER